MNADWLICTMIHKFYALYHDMLNRDVGIKQKAE